MLNALLNVVGPLQANIAMDEDKKEEQKKAHVDRSKLEADIKAQTDLASKVSLPCIPHHYYKIYCLLPCAILRCIVYHVPTSLQGKHAEAVESLLTLEKQSRLSEDITSTKMCCKAILEVLYNARDWQQLNEHILLLAKRRSQLKQVNDSSDQHSGRYLFSYPCARFGYICHNKFSAGCTSICTPGNGLR